MIKRRAFITIVGGSILAAPFAAEAQPAAKAARIGYLSPASAAADALYSEAFRKGLRALGYVEGQNIFIEARYADGRSERLSDFAAELVRLKVDVIVAAPTTAVRAAQRATRTIPIVMAFAGDPVGEGFAVGLARPGGNITRGDGSLAGMVHSGSVRAPQAPRARRRPGGAGAPLEIATRFGGSRRASEGNPLHEGLFDYNGVATSV